MFWKLSCNSCQTYFDWFLLPLLYPPSLTPTVCGMCHSRMADWLHSPHRGLVIYTVTLSSWLPVTRMYRVPQNNRYNGFLYDLHYISGSISYLFVFLLSQINLCHSGRFQIFRGTNGTRDLHSTIKLPWRTQWRHRGNRVVASVWNHHPTN